jgi:predicted nucleic acid-binding protein
VLDAWAAGRFELMVSPLMVDEYVRTCDRLSASYQDLEYQSILTSITGHGTLVPDTADSEPITADPDDDKFMLCAHGSGAIVVTGDQHLLDMDGWKGVRVMKPRDLLDFLPDESANAR